MATTPKMADIFKELKSAKSTKKKIEILHKHGQNPIFREFCAYVVNPHIKWSLPEGAPPYKSEGQPDSEDVLWSEIRRFYLFIDCPQSRNIKNDRKESIFIQVLEAVHPHDAQLLIDLKDGNIKSINEKIVNEAWPGFLTYD